jgi:MFS family permease
VTSTAARKLVTRFGVTPLLVVGLGLTVLSRVWLSQITVDGTYWVTLLPGLLLAGIGIGIGLVLVSASIAAVSGVSGAQAGMAAALFNTAQQVGGSLGVAVMSTLAIARGHQYLSTHAGTPGVAAHAAVSGFAAAFLLAAALAAVGLVVALLLVRPRRAAAGATREAVTAFDRCVQVIAGSRPCSPPATPKSPIGLRPRRRLSPGQHPPGRPSRDDPVWPRRDRRSVPDGMMAGARQQRLWSQRHPRRSPLGLPQSSCS